MSLPSIEKDPDANVTYGFDWSAWLPSGETITTAVASVDAGLTIVSESNTTTVHSVRVSGGTAGKSYTLTSRITTTPSSFIDDRSREIVVKER